MRSGSESKVGNDGREIVGAEASEPRETEEILGAAVAAATVAGENLTMVARMSRGDNKQQIERIRDEYTGTGAM